MQTRRDLLSASAKVAVMLAGAGLVPGLAQAQGTWNTAAFDARNLAELMKAMGSAAPTESKEVTLTGPDIAENGAVVCLQNGLCELRLADIAGGSRVLGAIVAWGATMVEPGVYDRTAAGGFMLGWLDGAIDERLTRLGHLLEAIGPVTLTNNLLGARWSKLALNCAVSSLGTVGGERLGPLLKHRFVRRLALELMSEVVAVARAESVVLEKVSGTIDLEWIALTAEEKSAKLGSPALLAKHALLLAVGTRYRRLRSSMLHAIERGATPSVDFLNGEVVCRGESHGVATPVNAAIRDAIWTIANGGAKPSLAALQALYLKTRS